MPRIAVSGRRGPPDAATRLAAEAIGASLRYRDGLITGLSSLADGADQIFARAVAKIGWCDRGRAARSGPPDSV
jgi:hypothetical protein